MEPGAEQGHDQEDQEEPGLARLGGRESEVSVMFADLAGFTSFSENFSNGMAWPGDPDGGADEVANCGCSVQFN